AKIPGRCRECQKAEGAIHKRWNSPVMETRLDTRHEGKIKFWNSEKGYGFIRPDDGTADLFLHISQYSGTSTPMQGDKVRFDVDPARGALERRAARNVGLA